MSTRRGRAVGERCLSPLCLFDEDTLYTWLYDHGYKAIHAQRIWNYILSHQLCILNQSRLITSASNTPTPTLSPINPLTYPTHIPSIPDVPETLVDTLNNEFNILTSTIQSIQPSSDKGTIKLLISLQDGSLIESVLIRYVPSTLSLRSKKNGQDEVKKKKQWDEKEEQREDDKSSKSHTGWYTLCVSSQIGCQMGCSFCATGTLGLKGNLLAGEILEQLIHANRVCRSMDDTVRGVRNIVFMGMGEPLATYDAVRTAVGGMCDMHRFGIAPSRITVSTVGLIPRMYDMARDMPHVQLAVSLHAPTQTLRAQIVPAGRAWHIDALMNAIDFYSVQCHQRIMIEYVMLNDVNDTEECAHQLGQLMKQRHVIVNLIPYNPTSVATCYTRPSVSRIHTFAEILYSYQVMVTIRQTKGDDVSAACGQLALVTRVNTSSIETIAHTHDIDDIEDMIAKTQPIKEKRGGIMGNNTSILGPKPQKAKGKEKTKAKAKGEKNTPKTQMKTNGFNPTQTSTPTETTSTYTDTSASSSTSSTSTSLSTSTSTSPPSSVTDIRTPQSTSPYTSKFLSSSSSSMFDSMCNHAAFTSLSVFTLLSSVYVTLIRP